MTPLQEAELPRIYSKEELQHLSDQIADQYLVSREVMRYIVQCESQWNPDAFNANENSRGLVQIHEPSWPDITDEQAYDPYFALSFLGEKLSLGQGELWSCFKTL